MTHRDRNRAFAPEHALRVLMVDSERSWRGGQAQVRLLMSGLAEHGVSVTLAAPGDGELYRRSEGLAIQRRAVPPGWAGVLALRRAMASGRFDVVHSHAARAHGAVAVARVGLARRPCHVVSRRVDFAVGRGAVSAWKYRRGADAYIAISEGVRRVLVDGGVAPERVRVAASGIDLAKFEGLKDRDAVRAELGLGAGTFAVGNVAALAPHKAQNDLLRAAAIVLAKRGDVRFFIVGEGALRAPLESLARELGIESRVVFTGFRADALDLLRAFDIFVMSSYLEGLGTSIMDAQAVGVPVVATRTGGIPELVDDGVTGLLVSPRDPGALAAGMLRFLDDEGLRRSCAHAARVRSSGYDYRTMVYKTLDVYRELCENVGSPLGPDGAD
ncbi:MAG: glycosyltransferase [Candidatus Latescibacteria bacterium]|nr:glycosyltransferase [Candidatus Latescibacterota bacterium]